MSYPHIALVHCPDYNQLQVEEALRRAIGLLGGMQRFVRPGETVIVKPNLLRASRPEEAIVTHPAVVRAVVRLVQEAGGQAIIADSPSGILNETLLRRAYRQAGWEAVAQETGAILNYNCTGVQVAHPEGRLIKRFDLLQAIVQADCIITVPKLKTHSLVRFTGATKILFGCIPGVLKAGYHTKLPEVAPFSEMLLDLLTLIKPRLSVMDAIVGMEGNGPSAGRPRFIGALLASADSVALDVVATSLVGMEPLSVPILKAAWERGMTGGRIAHVSVLGDSLQVLRAYAGLNNRAFQTPPANPDVAMVPKVVPKQARTWITGQLLLRPMADPLRCTGCQSCYQNCPVGAITMVNNKAVMDANKCIRCYCCHEICPEKAIDLKRGALGRVLLP